MPISVMIKPASSVCNLNCEYCFYSSLASERREYSKGMMSINTAENIIKAAVEFAKGSEMIFTFQGGEPLLAGINFYKAFADLVRVHNIYSSKITYCLQTNGTLLNADWCAFFKENHFLLGVSLDGNEIQNAYRVYPDGSASFQDVFNGIRLLQQFDVEFNVLSVVTKKLANSVREHYKFMKQNHIFNLQYINCLKPFKSEYNSDLYMNNDDYLFFLEKAFKLYYNDNMRKNRISVRTFDNYLLLLQGKHAEQCSMNGFCSVQFVVEGDGTVYPCDFYCTDEWEIGNINQQSFLHMLNSEKHRKFLKENCFANEKCRSCGYFNLCRGGGCKRNKANTNFCKAYKAFFSSSAHLMKNMLEFI